MGRPTVEGESPVQADELVKSILSTTEHANSVGSWVVHHPNLNTLDDR